MDPDLAGAYTELGLNLGASDAEVKSAWRRLVSQWHPDRNDSAAAVAKMQRINRAAEAIRRARVAHGGGRPAPPAPDTAEPPAAEPPRAQARREPPGHPAARTVSRKVKLTPEEAATGCTKVLRGQLKAVCAACAGAGVRVLATACPDCEGSGAVRQRAWFGWAGTPVACESCQGSGQARQACADCAGTGKAAAQRYQATVRFPPGVRDGDLLGVTIRPGASAASGAAVVALNIRVEVPGHALFEVQADGSVSCTVPVDGFVWIANRTIEVATPDGLRRLPLQRDQLRYRLAGQGFPLERGGSRGDLWIHLTPVFPDPFSTDQQILLDQLIATTSGPGAAQPDPRLSAWLQALQAWKRGA